jgi:predicted permease
MRYLLHDLQYGARSLSKNPGSAMIAVIALSLGIGLCTMMFSIFYGVFYRGLDVPDADRLALILETNPSQNLTKMGVPQHDYYDWREQQQSFEDLAAIYTGTINLSGPEGPERFNGGFVTANTFDILRVTPVLGSTFRQGDDLPGTPLTVVLGHDLWETRYESDPDVIGLSVRVNGEAATIIGVMPEGFLFPADQDLWVALRDSREHSENRRDNAILRVMGRLKDGVSWERAELEFATIAERLARQYPEANAGVGAQLITFIEFDTPHEQVFFGIAVMVFTTVLVLLIACSNVANLLLARAALRTREAAIRAAIGARRIRVLLPFFAEAVVLAACGSILGIGIAYYGTSLFSDALVGTGKPYYMAITVDLPILGWVLAISALTAIASGAAPAWQISLTEVGGVLNDESRGSSSLRLGKLSRTLVIGEIAMSCALLASAGITTKSIVKLRTYEYDFATDNIFTARVGLFETEYPDRATRTQFFRDLEERLQEVPGVQSVALADMLPGSCCLNRRFTVEGETYASERDYPITATASVTPDYFRAFEVEMSAGRAFEQMDDAGANPVVIVNQRFAERFFAGQNPIGRRIREGRMEGFDPGVDAAGYYVPIAQRDLSFVSMALQIRGNNPMVTTQSVRETVHALDADLPIYQVKTMGGVLWSGNWYYTVFGALFVAFGIAALFMASVGLYGVLSFSVSRRTNEMGIRMALGAGTLDVIRLVLRQGFAHLGIGLGIGLILAALLLMAVAPLMFESAPFDPAVFVCSIAVILVVGLVASLVPALRATNVDPVEALRRE